MHGLLGTREWEMGALHNSKELSSLKSVYESNH